MSAPTGQYTNLSNIAPQWRSLQEIQDSIQIAQLEVQNGQRYFRIREDQIPVSTIVNELYAYRPCLSCADESQLMLYLSTAKKFTDTVLQEPAEKSALAKISDCFWDCYFPIQFCWCTSLCREKVIIADSKLCLEDIQEWGDQAGA